MTKKTGFEVFHINKKSILMSIIPSMLVLLIVCIVYALKEIYPFGAKTIDYYDMGQQITAFYYHVYDALHGDKAWFFDWYSALGTNMAMNTSGCSSISIFNLFFLFVERNFILESLSILTALKYMAMAFSMYVFLHRQFSAAYYFKVCFSVCYGLCGFALMYYITNQWLDIAILFPLLMRSLNGMLEKKRYALMGYITLLTMCLAASYYLTFMILIYIIFYVGLRWLIIESYPKYSLLASENKSGSLWTLGWSTLCSLGLSAFIVLPQLLQTLSSARFNSSVEGGLISEYMSVLSQIKNNYTTGWWTLLGLSLSFAVIVYGIYQSIGRYKDKNSYMKSKDFRIDLFFICAIVLMCLELAVESINMLWHFGSYVHYPIRNGFTISFTILCAGCYYSKFIVIEKQQRSIRQILLGLVCTAVAAGTIVAMYAGKQDWKLRNVFQCSFIICALTFLVYSLIIWINRGKDKKLSLNLIYVLLAELFIFTYVLLGKPQFTTGYWEDPEQDGTYIATAQELVKDFDLEPARLTRIKNPDTLLNANYPFIMRVSALSNWTHIISPAFQQGAAKWGYTTQYTRLLDAGGTVFSDALLNIKQTLSVLEQDDTLYTKKGDSQYVVPNIRKATEEYTFSLYDSSYTLPWGMTVSDKIKDLDMEAINWIELQNALYQLLKPDSQLLTPIEDIDAGKLITADIVGKQVLYFSQETEEGTEKTGVIYINGEPVAVPTVGEPSNTQYPAYFNNQIVCLGVFEDEQVSVEFKTLEENPQIYLAMLDLRKLEKLCDEYKGYEVGEKAGKSSLSMEVVGTKDKNMLLLPIKYDKGWTVEINGENSEEFIPVAGIFTGIPLYEGSNKIEMHFFPQGMKAGIVISIAVALLLILLLIVDAFLKKSHAQEGNPAVYSKYQILLQTAANMVFGIAWYILILLFYLLPLLYAFILITKRVLSL